MPKSHLLALAGIMSVALQPALAEGAKTSIGKGEGQVDIVAWPGYIERGETDKAYDWVTDFEKETGCKVNVKTAGTSDEMVALMNEGGFDLVTASGDASLRLVAGKRVQEINTDLIPSWKTVDARLQNAPWHTVDGKHYGVPYQWGPNVLMYSMEAFKEAPKSWGVVFEEQELPDGKSNKGRVQAYDGAIYIADAALYLMAHKPELGIKDPYELNEDQYKAALDLLRGQKKIVQRYWHDATVQTDDFKNEGVVASGSWPYQVNLLVEREAADRLDHSVGRRHRLGRFHDDARRCRPSQLRLHVARAFAEPQAAGRPRGLVRLGSGRACGLQGQRAPDRRRLRHQRHGELRQDQILEDAGLQVLARDLRAVLSLGDGLHRRHRRPVSSRLGRATSVRPGLARP